MKIHLVLDTTDIVETYEILCNVLFVQSSISECKKREHGIEELIKQLGVYIIDED